MADEFGHHATAGNWWDSSPRTRFDSASGWPPDMIKSRSSMDSVSVSGSYDTAQGSDSAAANGGGLADPNLHMMGLGLSSQAMDWNQPLFRAEKSEGGFRSMLEPNGSFQFSSGGYEAPATLLQGLFDSEQQTHSFMSRSMNTNYQYNPANYGTNNSTNDSSPPTWSKVPQFLRTSPPKQPPLQFSNNAPFWNASADVRPSFFPSLHTQLPSQAFDDHKPPKINIFETRGEMGGGGAVAVAEKKSNETPSKRLKKESASPLPAFKVRKEKMGDRITALQQLVSPFGKTDTASVLSEAIEYIKFLHEQVNVLSTPYMKSGAPIQHQQSLDKSTKNCEGPKQDLRSIGLCLVPVSSTFPVAHEAAVDFWNPTFGGTFR